MAKPSGSKGAPNPTKPPKNKNKKKSSSGNRIQDQMEFYFSDSSLRRDKFLRQKISECVPLEVITAEDEAPESRLGLELSLFLNFNNIKAMTTEVSALQSALDKSSFLSCFQVTPTDGTSGPQWFVGRSDWLGRVELTEFLSELDHNNQEFDKRTIYCENLPINASQQWLRQIFSQFGKINLVSVPKFKGNQRIKQFAFVEFAEEAPLQEVLEYFKRFHGVLCYDDSENLQSIQKFHEEQEGSGDHVKGGNSNNNKNQNKRKNKNCNTTGTEKGDSEDAPKDVVEDEETKTDQEDKPAYPELNDNMIYDLKIMTK